MYIQMSSVPETASTIPAEYVPVMAADTVKWQLCNPLPPSAVGVLPKSWPATHSYTGGSDLGLR